MQNDQQGDGDLLYGVSAFASFLGVSRRRAQYLVESGRLPTFRLPGSRTIYGRRSTLTAWLADREAAAIAERKAKADAARR